uniref:SH3 domain-containing protein n=1 Tax=Strigamia maritima TaxID=126957 RepID=T1IQJ4_STRMM
MIVEVIEKNSSDNFYISFESYVAKNSDELSFVRGMVLEILSKNEMIGGLEGKTRPRTCSIFREMQDCQTQPLHEKFGNGTCGQEINVLNEDPSGWSYISVAGKTGWAPSAYLKIISKSASDETS